MKKRIISIILSLLIVISILPVGVFAEETVSYKEIHVNPLYSDVVTAEDIASSVRKPVRLNASSNPEYLTSLDDAAAVLREGMEDRKAQITIYYATTDDNPLEEIAEAAMDETGVPTQGDYIRWTYEGWEGELNGYREDGLYYLTIVYYCAYYTTAKQESELTERVNNVLASFDFSADATEYEIISTIYDYICANVTYDYDNLNDDDYLLKYTAYAAMMNGTSVCQGYATLLYRMLLQEGVGCRLIPGGNHAWNIVEINNIYYNVDSTWDSGATPENYAYFLLSDNDFTGHTRYDDYRTDAFYKAYPMAELSYAVHSEHDWGQSVISSEPTCTECGIMTYSCTQCSAEKTEEIPALGHNYEAVVTAPTAEAKGYTTYTCTGCGDSYVDSYTVAAPALTAATNKTTGKVKLSWEAIDGAAYYTVYRATSKDGTYAKLTTTKQVSYTDKSAEAGTAYYYKIKVNNADDAANSAYSAVVKCTCDCAKPVVTVSNNAATGKVKLSWKAIDGAAYYSVYRATSKDGTYTKIKTTKQLNYTDTSAVAGKTYYYKVKANNSNSAANSAYSTIMKAVCDCARPAVSIKLSSGHPKLTWSAIDKASYYSVYRATSKDGTYTKLKTTKQLSYTDKTATAGKTYYYKVVANNSVSAANSAYSTVDYIKAK